jgi:hypothetical protein
MAGVLILHPFVNAAPVPALPIADATVTGPHKAIWEIAPNGFTYGHPPGSVIGPWITPQSGMSSWSVRVTQLSGNPISLDAGQGVWLPMSGDYKWGYQIGTAFAESATLSVEFSNDAGATVAKTITITLTVTDDDTPSDERRLVSGGGRQVSLQ